MTHLHTDVEGPELISAPSVRLATGEIVTYWQGPPRVRDIHPGRDREYRRAEALLTVGLARIRTKPRQYAVARRCFHAATCLHAWALGADRRLAFAWDRLGYAYHGLGDNDEAEQCYLRSLAIQAESGQDRTTWNEVTLLNLARIYHAAGHPALTRAVLSSYDPEASHVLPGVLPLADPAPPPARSN